VIRPLTKKFLVKGLNREILLNRLKKSGVLLHKIKIIDEKSTEITIDSKDAVKFFAICQKMWYNKMIRVGGFLAPFYLMVKNPTKLVALLISLAVILCCDRLHLKTVYQGDALLVRSEIERVIDSCSSSRFPILSDKRLGMIEKELKQNNSFGYLSVTRRGNALIFNVKTLAEPPQSPTTLKSDLIAFEDMKILKATVYSGTLLKQPGEIVKRGEVIAGAYQTVEEQTVGCELLAFITAECSFSYTYKPKYGIDSQSLSKAYAVASFLLGDYEVISHTERIDKDKIIVEIKYEKIICGG